MKLNAAFCSRPGARSHNEDALWCGIVVHGEKWTSPGGWEFAASSPWALAVADGLGGYGNGAAASRYVIEAIARIPPDSKEGWESLIARLHLALKNPVNLDIDMPGGGTTLAALSSTTAGLLAVNVGDSRIYYVESGYLSQVSKDDSRCRRRADVAGMSLEAGNSLSQAIGGPRHAKAPKVHFRSLPNKSARYLLCTDGVTDALPLDLIEADVCPPVTPIESANALAARIQMHGSDDNFSFIIVDVFP